MNEVGHKLAELEGVLRGIGPVAVAVSGGVDSITLAVFALLLRKRIRKLQDICNRHKVISGNRLFLSAVWIRPLDPEQLLNTSD